MPATGKTTVRKKRWIQAIQIVVQQQPAPANYELWKAFFCDEGNKTYWPIGEPQRAAEFPPRATWYTYLKAVPPKDDLDRPWSISQLAARDVAGLIESEALPDITRLWFRATSGGRTLSIRQALWAARARHLIGEDIHNTERYAVELYNFAIRYSLREIGDGGALVPSADMDGALVNELLILDASTSGITEEMLNEIKGISFGSKVAVNLGMIEGPPSSGPGPYHQANINNEIAADLQSLVLSESGALNGLAWHELPLWQSTVIMYGLQAIARQNPDWVYRSRPSRRSDTDMAASCTGVVRAVLDADWTKYRELTDLNATESAQNPESVVN